MKLKKLLEIKFVRFLLTGGLNTALTYILYLALLSFLPYIWSYSISYVCGIFLAFLLSRFFVFKEHQGLKSALLFPFVYLAQYILGVFIVWLWVKKLSLPDYLAPLAAIALTLPLTFVLSRLVFVKGRTPAH
ncbi:GtrA family protein [Pseudomonas iranensis]|uniref:GtrA family protein n=1 Tax=Pseudomonas iranensis TaxID=2745503 RepID=UPI0016470044|nr:GtrA family protein [Pseudomonas iranensis]QXI21348.1 GtrA family protein [Pseudomonas iranensis]